MSPRILVAGVGNVFLGDDAFGVEVANRLLTAHAADAFAEDVNVADFGVRGVHLAYELLNGYDVLVLIDAVARGGEPGSVYVLERDLDQAEPGSEGPALDGHGMSPDAVLSLCKTLSLGKTLSAARGGLPVGQVYIIGCEPADCSEGMGLSAPVEAAVDLAAQRVRTLLADVLAAAH